ncbi:S-layer homology domain-containing protein [Alkaliphilus serpentinus]|uniref:S-layer homology domain-containing protein n=1 Tax=Alkaliphilus serpentinus TaxID=1482731 RepID=A0A833M7V5_9FIRM|nr:S-layer homology domain-containing protein [Alkaliphilus serpentinus]KAB3529317.1 S-layer homology domain-containing protein [Alkaliphilus serpentinus]
MKKRIFASLICVLMILALYPVDAGAITMADIPTSIGAPENVGVGVYPYYPENGEIEWFEIGFSADENIQKFGDMVENGEMDKLGLNSCNLSVQLDYKYNEDGSWQYTSEWDTEGAYFEAGADSAMYSANDVYIVNGTELDPIIDNVADLQDNTFYFRARFLLSYFNSETEETIVLISPWSETVMYGKNAFNEKVTSIEAPVLKNVELKTDDYGAPYFVFTAENPDSVKKLNNSEGSITTLFQMRKTGEEWGVESGGSSGMLFEEFYQYPEDIGGMNEINIEANTYEFRMRYGYSEIYAGDTIVYSPYSNVLTIGTPAYYQGASNWAVEELNKAAVYGLITEKIKDKMAGKITREEFAEIAVKLYEKYTGDTAAVGNASFVDTNNPEILKAANLGLVTGIGNNKYAPNDLVTREQMATILLRALKVLNPTEDFSTEGATKFTDDDKIESWAKDGVYYCAKAGIVTGVGSNKFDPDGSATREAAVIVCTRAYEYFSK